jgi:alpha-beta hydrolase superfamily lysophospholipase
MTDNGAPEPTAPDTIVLIHGLWVTPRSWEHWIEHYQNKGYRVLAPAYPQALRSRWRRSTRTPPRSRP